MDQNGNYFDGNSNYLGNASSQQSATPQKTATPTPQPAAQPVAPTAQLQPGSTDAAAVKQLQDYLVAQGYMTEAQKMTGYGIYGPQTTAAVAALQKKLGVDNSSGVGYYGPRTQAAIQGKGTAAPGQTPSQVQSVPTDIDKGAAALDSNYLWQPGETAQTYQARVAEYNATKPVSTVQGQVGQAGTMARESNVNDPYAGLDPIQKQVKMYTDAYNALGLSTIKEQFTKYTKDLEKVQNELNDKKQANQNNPWLAQGIVDRTNEQLDRKYETRINTLTHLLSLTDSLYKAGQAQVNQLVSDAQADIKATNELAQKAIDAATALSKDNVIQSIGGHQWLVNKSTGQKIADLGPVTVSSTAMSLEDKMALAAFQAGLRDDGNDETSDIKNYNYARSQGYKGTFQQYTSSKNDPFANLFPDDAPSSTPQRPLSLYDQVKTPAPAIDWASIGL